VPAGLALIAFGSTQGHDASTVCGIVAVTLGLACWRVVFWLRRVRLLTEVGRSLRVPDHPSGGSQLPPSRQ
jgi:hypothetical protein